MSSSAHQHHPLTLFSLEEASDLGSVPTARFAGSLNITFYFFVSLHPLISIKAFKLLSNEVPNDLDRGEISVP